MDILKEKASTNPINASASNRHDFTFAHLSDVHLGIWHAHPELSKLAMKSFESAVNKIIEQKMPFVIISGDFYDTSMPPIEIVKFSVEQLHKLKDNGISVYAIAGSHDYSPTGKTMMGVLESARLLKNVHLKPTIDGKTGISIVGVEGLRGGLDKYTYESLTVESTTETSVPKNAQGFPFSIFMSHVALQEYAIPQMKENSLPLDMLPKGFGYYANGHIHERRIEYHNDVPVVFPGPIFPCDFTELEKINHGSFCIVSVKDGKAYPKHEELKLADVVILESSAEGNSPSKVEQEFVDKASSIDAKNRIILLKCKGCLSSGKPSDINWRRISDFLLGEGAIAVKNSIHVTMKELESGEQAIGSTVHEVEQKIITSFVKTKGESDLVEKMMQMLSIEKTEEQSKSVFEERIKSDARKVLEIS